jgi:hypothetical protein
MKQKLLPIKTVEYFLLAKSIELKLQAISMAVLIGLARLN